MSTRREGADPSSDPRRHLPSVDRLAGALVERDAALAAHPWACAVAAREEIVAVRERLAEGDGAPSFEDLAAAAAHRAAGLARPRPRRVINATGIVVHTNLGRSPLAPEALTAAAEAAGYCDLEYDLATGRRGNRLAGIGRKLELLSGAEAGFAVNNNAAALMLAVNTMAAGREVLVSRGELVEIGGSFRIPEIMSAAGARLVEVGTTNRTHPEDYARAIGTDTGLLLKVHRSNFEQRGFVREVALSELVEIGRKAQLPVLEDVGSGLLLDWRERGWPDESFVPGRLRLGADVVCFSGDKLLGGPQAGILLGDRESLAAMRRNPLARALRLDKLTLALLDWTLGTLLDGRAEKEIPVLRALREDAESVKVRAEAMAAALRNARVPATIALERCESLVGGGSLPDFRLPSWAAVLRDSAETPFGIDELAERLRAAAVPVVGRVDHGGLWFDARTLGERDIDELVAATAAALKPKDA